METKELTAEGLTPETKRKIIALCKAIIPHASISIYGSRARGDFHHRSDIDLVLEAPEPIDFFAIAELKDILKETNIPYKIDIVDINSISDENFKKAVQRDKILWQK